MGVDVAGGALQQPVGGVQPGLEPALAGICAGRPQQERPKSGVVARQVGRLGRGQQLVPAGLMVALVEQPRQTEERRRRP